MDFEYIALGKLSKVFGIKGHLCFFTHSGEYGHLHRVSKVYLGASMTEFLVDEWVLKGTRRVKLQGLNNPEDARDYTQLEIFVDKKYSVPLDQDEYYVSDLIGLEIKYAGQNLGTVVGLITNTYAPLFEVRSSRSSKLSYVPFKKEFFSEPNFKEKEIEIYIEHLIE